MPRALAGSNVEHNFGGERMSNEIFLALIVLAIALTVAVLTDDDPFA
jgi:hypothetical protein